MDPLDRLLHRDDLRGRAHAVDRDLVIAAANPAGFHSSSGASFSVGFAPAIEYNWTARVGAILGVRIIEIGRNTAATVTPAIALSMVF